ncbi:MAG: hypothetical protein LH632_09960 [Rhodoferax sp.]|nr:hypothetical protein [Rhodoferax sp.]
MNTTWLTAWAIVGPMVAALRRFGGAANRTQHVTPRPQLRQPLAASKPLPDRPLARPAGPVMRRTAQKRPALRVLRIVESGSASSHSGRLIISGRMADVCAELDRMAEHEAALRIAN